MAFIFGGKHFNIWHLLPSEQQNRKIITFAKMKSMQATAKITLNESYFDELMLSHRQPSRISHADGYVSLDENGDATFYYYLTDHLGNVRSVITPDTDGKPQVEQANDYFTFGMSFESRLPYLTKSGSGSNKHKYNGKEEQEMPGKWLDYGGGCMTLLLAVSLALIRFQSHFIMLLRIIMLKMSLLDQLIYGACND
jgi:hypothetical protein